MPRNILHINNLFCVLLNFLPKSKISILYQSFEINNPTSVIKDNSTTNYGELNNILWNFRSFPEFHPT
uniref:Uncharacterized protein n=1 Tax=Rhizophagus irregularis (strain DAOM 181602 / DAOM 197198 / MUCL 43194) TaxID=747089 RepID=U9TIC7_RHIID